MPRVQDTPNFIKAITTWLSQKPLSAIMALKNQLCSTMSSGPGLLRWWPVQVGFGWMMLWILTIVFSLLTSQIMKSVSSVYLSTLLYTTKIWTVSFGTYVITAHTHLTITTQYPPSTHNLLSLKFTVIAICHTSHSVTPLLCHSAHILLDSTPIHLLAIILSPCCSLCSFWCLQLLCGSTLTGSIFSACLVNVVTCYEPIYYSCRRSTGRWNVEGNSTKG